MKRLRFWLTFIFLVFQYTKTLKGCSVIHLLLNGTYIHQGGPTGSLRKRHRSAPYAAGAWGATAEKRSSSRDLDGDIQALSPYHYASRHNKANTLKSPATQISVYHLPSCIEFIHCMDLDFNKCGV